MNSITVLWYYLRWHYSRALLEGFVIGRNTVWFVYHFFSVPILMHTFLAPFQRLGEPYKKGFYLQYNLSVFTVNTLMRIVGVCMRSVLIVVGIIATLMSIGIGIFALLMWLVLPFGTVVALAIGLYNLV